MGFLDDDSESSESSLSSLGDLGLSDSSNSDDGGNTKRNKVRKGGTTKTASKSTTRGRAVSVSSGTLEDRLRAIRNLKKDIGLKESDHNNNNNNNNKGSSAGERGQGKLQRHKSLQAVKRPVDRERTRPHRNKSFNARLDNDKPKSMIDEHIEHEELTVHEMMSKIREKHRKSSRKLNLSSSSGMSLGTDSTGGSTEHTDEMDEFLRLKQKREAKRNKLKKRASQKKLMEKTNDDPCTTPVSIKISGGGDMDEFLRLKQKKEAKRKKLEKRASQKNVTKTKATVASS